MKHPQRKKLYIALSLITAVAAAGALIFGITAGLFSSQITGGANNFTAGTVSLTKVAEVTCQVNTPPTVDVKPGDSGTCTLDWSYAGNPAWVAVDIANTTAAAASVPTPYGATVAPAPSDLISGMTFTINGTSVALAPNSSTNDVLLSVPTTPNVNGDTGTVTLGWALPRGAGNQYQGATATVTMIVHAVQSKHNPESQTLTCTQYHVCTTPPDWS